MAGLNLALLLIFMLTAIYFNFLNTGFFKISIKNLQKFQQFFDCRVWQENLNSNSIKFWANLEHIINFAGFSTLSIYRDWLIFGYLVWYHHLPVSLVIID